MRLYTIFECEKCGKQSSDKEEIMECEASHLGLTVAEKQERERLKEDVRYKGVIVGSTKNEITDRDLDEAVSRVLEFKKQHGIKAE